MADEVSNKTLAILVAIVLVISVVGTWTMLTSSQETDLSWYEPNAGNTANGKVMFNIGESAPATSDVSARVSLFKAQ